MLLASMMVERFHCRRGVAKVGHLLVKITANSLKPQEHPLKAVHRVERMCERPDRQHGGRASRPALAYQQHFGGAAADRREERKEHLKLCAKTYA